MTSNLIAEQVSKKARNHAMALTYATLAEVEHELAGRVNADRYPDEITAIVVTLPKDWWRLDECVRTSDHRGYSVRLQRKKDFGVVCPISDYCYDRSIKNKDLSDEVAKYLSDREAANEKASQIERDVYALVKSTSSVKKLHEIWPEGVEFYQEFLTDKAKSTALALPIEQINKALGLPTVNEAA